MRGSCLVLVGLLVAGCAVPSLRPARPLTHPDADGRRGWDGDARWIAQADERTRAGDYGEAEVAYRHALEASAQTSGADRALFGLGRLYAAVENPNRDYRRAYQHFDRLLSEYPRSQLAGEARTWRALLATVSTQGDEMALLRREVDRLRQEMQRERQEAQALLRREVDRLRQEMQRERQEAQRIRQDLERLTLRELELERERQQLR